MEDSGVTHSLRSRLIRRRTALRRVRRIRIGLLGSGETLVKLRPRVDLASRLCDVLEGAG